MRTTVSICRLLLAGMISVAPFSHAQSGQGIRQTMHNTFDAIAYLLPLSLRDETRITEDDKRLIQRHTALLASSGEELMAHAQAREPEFRMLSASLDRAVEQVVSAFGEERYVDAYFALSDMSDNCVACHSRLPDDSDYMLGQKLFARMDVSELERGEIARLYIATRQFDLALKTLEDLILDQSLHPADLDLDDVLIDYLQICIAVTGDLTRLDATLRRFADRDDVPLYLNRHVEIWRAAVKQLAGELSAQPSLEHARRIFDEATGLTLAPAGRERAVHDVVAASILRRLLAGPDALPPEQVAEAYYLLGVIALRTMSQKPAVPEMEFLLSSAIRADPKGRFALPAYALLEEFSFTHYLDFGGEPLPDAESGIDMRTLRDMIE